MAAAHFPPPTKSLHLRIAAVLVTALSILAASPAPVSAGSSKPYIAQRSSHRDCVAENNSNCVPKGWLSRGTEIRMHCWADGRWAKGRYKSDRWFYMTAPGGVRGYVHSSNVENQSKVPHCGGHRGISAATWASERVGETGTALTSDGYWSGWCAYFASQSHIQTGRPALLGLGTAKAYYNEYAERGLMRHDMDPSRIWIGALVYWPDVTSYGHAAVYVGNGYVVSTMGIDDPGRPVERVPLDHWGGRVGWVAPGHVDGS